MIHLFTLAFVILKLMGYINWAWWLVLAPSWAGILFGIFMALLAAALSSKGW